MAQPQNSAAAVLKLERLASFPRMRALAWAGKTLYASQNYELLAAEPDVSLEWRRVAIFDAPLLRRMSARSRLTHRLLRDGFHALAVLASGHLVGVVPGAIITLVPGEPTFRITHKITRGTRPLHITATPNGDVFWGEYYDNKDRTEVFLYGSTDRGETWNVAHTFPAKAVRHVHNIVFDRWHKCLWISTGDSGSECRILRATVDLKNVVPVLEADQQARAVALLATPDGLYFTSDTPLESNYIYRLDQRGGLDRIAPISSSSIYGCAVNSALFFSTMVEPSKVNPIREARLYGSISGVDWRPYASWPKDMWPMKLFQYGNILLPDGNNQTDVLAATTVAVAGADLDLHLWRVNEAHPESTAHML